MTVARQLAPRALALRLRTRRRRDALDRALALGAAPSASAELALRARELERPQTRRGMAGCLINLIDAAEEPVSNWRACGIASPVRSQAVLDARDELIALAEALTVPDSMSVSGLALAARLIWDRQSPIFSSAARVDVATWARHAREGIEASRVG